MSDSILVEEWMRYAGNDLIVAKHSFDDLYPKQLEIACYLSQQCAEKSLKAVLIYYNVEPLRTHDLIALCEMCIKQDSDFTVLREHCRILMPYGVQVRYPNELTVDDTLAKTAIDKARQVFDFCLPKILPDIRPQ